jgi:hypothetical protein
VKAERGTSLPSVVFTYTARSPVGFCQNSGATSRITWYWLSDVYMVETGRCPNAS